VNRFEPRLSVLPAAQRELWSALAPVPHLGFTLYGGTALAVRFGHRESVDFDFFSDRALEKAAIHERLPFIVGARVLQDEPDTLTVLLDRAGDEVKLSFFGGIGFGRVADPDLTEDGVLEVASVDDLFATKLKVLLQRIEAKDYLDIAALIRHGASLERGLAAARALYGPAFQPSESLKALTYFDGGDLDRLASSDRRLLESAVRTCGNIPQIHIIGRELALLLDY
jgi:nucleotidyltransferase AbiEii toxin of type IV toxin-antitoxin system